MERRNRFRFCKEKNGKLVTEYYKKYGDTLTWEEKKYRIRFTEHA
jgi:hypothetical protein